LNAVVPVGFIKNSSQ